MATCINVFEKNGKSIVEVHASVASKDAIFQSGWKT